MQLRAPKAVLLAFKVGKYWYHDIHAETLWDCRTRPFPQGDYIDCTCLQWEFLWHSELDINLWVGEGMRSRGSLSPLGLPQMAVELWEWGSGTLTEATWMACEQQILSQIPISVWKVVNNVYSTVLHCYVYNHMYALGWIAWSWNSLFMIILRSRMLQLLKHNTRYIHSHILWLCLKTLLTV
jgi:hypothetical protein